MQDTFDHGEGAYARFETQDTFATALAAQTRRAPYLLASLAFHALLGLFFAGYELLQPRTQEAPLLSVQAPPPPPPIEPEKPQPQPLPEPEIVEPAVVESDVPAEEVAEAIEDLGDPTSPDRSDPFDSRTLGTNAIGVGAGPGGDHGIRSSRGRPRSNHPSEAAVAHALRWLADHQAPEGYWDCDQFPLYDKLAAAPPSDGAGSAVNDVGVTGLALLAFLGAGHTTGAGEYREVVARGVNWLRAVQRDDGLLGEEVGNPTLYNHAIATMALGEAYYFSRSPILRPGLERAVRVILNARNPYLAWRYRLEPNGDNDSSITGWMVFALETARDAGLPIGKDAFDGAEAWFAQLTDPQSGRTGYDLAAGAGSRPSRLGAYAARFPAERSEALTAVALLCRLFTAPRGLRSWREHPEYALLQRQADLLLRTPPHWDEAGGTIDLYYWYYGTFAMYQWGGKHWESWRGAMEQALLPHQRQDGNYRGSWDPQIDAWGSEGGRVYTTALGAIILEVYYRYAQVLGAR